MKKWLIILLIIINIIHFIFSQNNYDLISNKTNNNDYISKKDTIFQQTNEKEMELKLKNNGLWILFLIIFIGSFACSGLFIFWNVLFIKLKKENNIIEENNDNLILNDDDNGDIFMQKKCRIQCCCKYCSEDIMYGITFIGRLVMTLYSFQALFFLYNIIINFIFLVPGMLYYTDNMGIKVLINVFYAFFASFCSNILIIPTYELFLFSFIKYKNILAHLESLKLTVNIIQNNKHAKDKIELKKSNIIIDFILIVIELCYAIGFICGLSSKTVIFKDIIRVIIYVLIYIYYLLIFLGYIIVATYLRIKFLKKIINDYKCINIVFVSFFHMDEFINNFFFKRQPLPKISLLCYTINPLLNKSYENIEEAKDTNKRTDCFNFIRDIICCNLDCCENCSNCCCSCKCKKCFHTFKNMIRAITFFISFILSLLIISIKQESAWYVYIVLIIFFLSAYLLSSMLNFPYILRNKKVFFLFSTKYRYKKEYNLEHPILISIVRLVSFSVIFVFSLGLLFVYLTQDEGNNLQKIRDLEFEPFKGAQNKTNLKPSICFSSIEDMYVYLFLPFINDAYYYDNNPTVSPDFYSSFNIKGYKELFFNDTLFEIRPIGNLITSNEINKVKMIQYDVTIKSYDQGGNIDIDNELTILSIKGTTNKKDVFLDLQLYLPSVLLTYLSYFSLLSQQKDTISFRFLEFSLSLPYRVFCQYLIIDGYLRDLLKAYNDNKSKFKNNLLIVGHSLGGGLSKILGRFLGKQAISLSGPGVNAFHSLWEYEGSSDDFEISAIDLVPDMDLVPRVEISGGTIYRIICKEGPLKCHSKELSLCEVLIMCRNPNYEQYCTKMAKIDQEQIEAIKESSEL